MPSPQSPTDPSGARAAAGEQPALELRGVTSGYGATVVLRDVSVSVPPSSVVAVLGPNGAGKTTLLRTAAGLNRLGGGGVYLDGRSMSHDSPARRSRAGMCLIPEGRAVFRSLSVRENLLLQAPKGEQAAAIEMAVSAFPALGRRLAQIAGSLSGGEQQMLALCRAYIGHPRLVLVDEASLGLAPLIVDEVFSFLQTLARSGTALLLVEQFVARALELADRVYVLVRGEIVFAGTPGELRASDVFSAYLGAQPALGADE
jgi:branched-chain amino acid transport system ATP-binding protein